MKKILFGITSLTLGGAEKVLVDLANKLSEKYEITILTIYAKGEFEKKLNSKVKLKSIYDFQFNDMKKFKKKFTALKLLLFKKHFYKKYGILPEIILDKDNVLIDGFCSYYIAQVWNMTYVKIRRVKCQR